MKRVFTDERFPNLQVVIEGGARFTVLEDGHVIDEFSTWADGADGNVSDGAAQRRAQDYFNHMAKGTMSHEFQTREREKGPKPPPGFSKNAPKQEQSAEAQPPYGLSQSKSLDSLMKDQVLTADDVLDRYSQAKAMQDPSEQEKAMNMVRHAANQLESLSFADELVRDLLQ
jgi:hypothetical protein